MSDEIVKQDEMMIQGDPDDLMRVAANADKMVAAMKQIKAAVLKFTHSGDWVDEGGKPYLQSSGAEKLIKPFNVSSRFLSKPEVVPEPDGHYCYHVPMEITIGRSCVQVIGRRSTRDSFFTTRYKYDGEGKRQQVELPPGEVDRGDVLGAAISNGLANGISRILGLRNLTWVELNAAGIFPTQKVRFDGQKAPSTAKPEEEGDQVISENQGKRLYAIAKGQSVSDEALTAHLYEKYAYKSTKEISRKHYDEIVKWAQAGGQEAPVD